MTRTGETGQAHGAPKGAWRWWPFGSLRKGRTPARAQTSGVANSHDDGRTVPPDPVAKKPGSTDHEHLRCMNCQTPLTGPFCSVCGQRDDDYRRPFVALSNEFMSDVFQWDSRILRSIPVFLLAPGTMTRAFMQGRRGIYVTPLRLYFVVSLIFFIALGVFDVAIVRIQADGLIDAVADVANDDSETIDLVELGQGSDDMAAVAKTFERMSSDQLEALIAQDLSAVEERLPPQARERMRRALSLAEEELKNRRDKPLEQGPTGADAAGTPATPAPPMTPAPPTTPGSPTMPGSSTMPDSGAAPASPASPPDRTPSGDTPSQTQSANPRPAEAEGSRAPSEAPDGGEPDGNDPAKDGEASEPDGTPKTQIALDGPDGEERGLDYDLENFKIGMFVAIEDDEDEEGERARDTLSEEQINRLLNNTDESSREDGAKLLRILNVIATDPRIFNSILNEWLPRLMIFLVPLFAFVVSVLYGRRRGLKRRVYFIDHLVFSLHFHAFIFALMTALVLKAHYIGTLINGSLTAIFFLVSISLYLLVSMKRVYGQGYFKTTVKFLFMMVFLTVTYVSSLVGITVYGLWMLRTAI